MSLVTVVLMDSENISQHASGKIDGDKVIDITLLKRNGRLYAFRKLENGVAFYVECSMSPYEITEF